MDSNPLNPKRIYIIAGHYGSGKTNISVNLALSLTKAATKVALADLDIVNPYFRSKDSQTQLENAGVRVICSSYANTNVDIPALPPAMYAITDDKSLTSVLDIGGDDRGALVLGRLAGKIKEENNYHMLLTVNCYRPETRDADSAIEIMQEMERASGIAFTGIINNSNLGEETTAQSILKSLDYARSISEKAGIPVVMTTVKKELFHELSGKVSGLFSLELQEKYF